ncbi:MAG: aminopeptidase [Halobacteriota archaeon]
MDPRIREHAEVLVDWSARVEPGDDVVVEVDEGSIPLAIAVAEVLGERESNPLLTFAGDDPIRAYLRSFPTTEFPEDPAHALALYEETDVLLRLRGGTNTSAMADVPTATRQAYARARRSLTAARLETDWVSTLHPTASLAQQAFMATEAFRDFVYEAILRDWAALADEMVTLKDALDAGSEVRLTTEQTDLTMSIDGRRAVNSAASVAYDSHNLPSGEVFTAPYATEGVVVFDVPMMVHGEPVRDVRLTFESGEVVDIEAEVGQSVIEGIVETDEGARRLGELGIGMNRAIDRITNITLLDEKMGDTVHLALGRAYDACLPEGESGNQSAVHVDLIADVSEGASIAIDGEVVQRDGRFAWE